MVQSGKMPKEQAKLSAEEIVLIREWMPKQTARPGWIRMPWASGGGTQLLGVSTDSKSQGARRRTHPVDAFLLRRLHAEG